MKLTSEVIAALKTLQLAAENDSEKNFISEFENNFKIFVGEIWKDIEGYEGIYQVSNKGRIKSFYGVKEKILVTRTKGHDYEKVLLSKNGVGKTFLIHRLVAKAFIPNPENKPEVNHIDGNKKNNCVENLEWMTCSENTKHAFDTGLAKVLRGANNGAARLTPEQIKEIRATYKKDSKTFCGTALAKKYHVGPSTISRIVNNETYKDIV